MAGSPARALSTEVETARSLLADRPTMEELQSRYFQLVLSEVGGNRHHAAQVLGLNRRTVQRLIARYGLNALTSQEFDTAEEDLDI
jgi:transcriptional regulator with GAF, ATPase, and Fis domain